MQKNVPRGLQPKFISSNEGVDHILNQPDQTLVEKIGANIVQFRAPAQDEDVLRSLAAPIRVAGVYCDSHGVTQTTNDFVFQYVLHSSPGDMCIYCQFDVDGVTEEFDEIASHETMELDQSGESYEGVKLQIMPLQTSGGLQPYDGNSTDSWMDNVEYFMWTLRHSMPPVYTLAEVLAKSDLQIQIPDPIGVFNEVFLSFNKVII